MKKMSLAAASSLAVLSFLFGAAPMLSGVVHTGVWALLTLSGLCCLWIWLTLFCRIPLLSRLAGIIILAALAGGCLLSIPMACQAFCTPPDGEPSVVVVLGAKVQDGQPSRILANRLDTALRVLEQYPESPCIVSGGQGKNESSTEAAVMASYLEERGIDPSRIFREEESGNTRQNISNTAALIQTHSLPRQVILVTDSFHQLRASIHGRLEELMVRSVSSPTPWGLFPSYWVREFFGVCALPFRL